MRLVPPQRVLLAALLTLIAGLAVTPTLAAAASLRGKVTAPGGGAGKAFVVAYPAGAGAVATASTQADGTWTISGLAAGAYRVSITDADAAADRAPQFYPGKAGYTEAQVITLAADDERTGVDAQQQPGTSIAGRVTAVPGGGPGELRVEATTIGSGASGSSASADPTTGQYTVHDLAAGRYAVHFVPFGGSNVAGEFYDDSATSAGAMPVDATVGAPAIGIDAQLAEGGSIAGKVTVAADGSGLRQSTVRVTRFNDPTDPGSMGLVDAADGSYSVPGLLPGEYAVQLSGPSGSDYIGQWFNGTTNRAQATKVTVTAGATRSGVDAALVRGGTIALAAKDAQGTPVTDAAVSVYGTGSTFPVASTLIGPAGRYVARGLPAGRYAVYVSGVYPAGWVGQWYKGVTAVDPSSSVVVAAGADTPLDDVVLAPGGYIAGRVKDTTGAAVPSAFVAFGSAAGTGVGIGVNTLADGTYRSPPLPIGAQRVRFDATRPGLFAFEWWDDAPTEALATPVAVMKDAVRGDINPVLTFAAPPTGDPTDGGDPPGGDPQSGTATGSSGQVGTTAQPGVAGVVASGGSGQMTVIPPAQPPAAMLLPKLTAAAPLAVKTGKVTVPVTCPVACAATLYAPSAAHAAKPRAIGLGRAAAGATKLSVRLNRLGRRLVRRGQLKATLAVHAAGRTTMFRVKVRRAR